MSKILLVDDDPELLELYSDVLELMGHLILRAHDGREALGLARRWLPDLVVTDWMMPEMCGVELCHALASDEELRHIPVIMHSASGNPHAPHAQAFLPKGCRLECFEEVVTRTLTSAPPATHWGGWGRACARAASPPAPDAGGSAGGAGA